MRKSIFLFVFSLFFLMASVSIVKAEGYLFVSTTCPHCKSVEQQLAASGEDKLLNIEYKVVDTSTENYNSFLFAIEKCSISPNSAGVPMFFVENECYVGETDVMAKINGLAALIAPQGSDGVVVAEKIAVTPTAIPIVNPGVPVEEAKANTLIFIAVMAIALVLLVAVGYWKQKGEASKASIIAFVTLLLTSFNLIVLSHPVLTYAFCPVCTVAVGAGLGFSKQLGIDDVISSIWIGGLLVSMSLWLIEWLDKKKIRFLFRKPLIFIVMYALVIWPLSSSGVIGGFLNTFWGVDKIVLGIIFGSIGFIAGYILSDVITKQNNNRVHFPFQKVVLPLSVLIILSLLFFFLVY